MYAVFSACGRQYKVKKGDTLQVELLQEKLGATTSFSEVLLIGEGASIKIGTPFVDKASVTAEVVGIEKGPKIDIMHYKRRKQFKRHVGHRQPYTRLLITGLSNGTTSDSLTKQEQEAIMKRVGFVARDEYAPALSQEESVAKKKEKQKARLAKQEKRVSEKKPVAKKAKAGAAKKKSAGKKKSAKASGETTKKKVTKSE